MQRWVRMCYAEQVSRHCCCRRPADGASQARRISCSPDLQQHRCQLVRAAGLHSRRWHVAAAWAMLLLLLGVPLLQLFCHQPPKLVQHLVAADARTVAAVLHAAATAACCPRRQEQLRSPLRQLLESGSVQLRLQAALVEQAHCLCSPSEGGAGRRSWRCCVQCVGVEAAAPHPRRICNRAPQPVGSPPRSPAARTRLEVGPDVAVSPAAQLLMQVLHEDKDQADMLVWQVATPRRLVPLADAWLPLGLAALPVVGRCATGGAVRPCAACNRGQTMAGRCPANRLPASALRAAAPRWRLAWAPAVQARACCGSPRA